MKIIYRFSLGMMLLSLLLGATLALQSRPAEASSHVAAGGCYSQAFSVPDPGQVYPLKAGTTYLIPYGAPWYQTSVYCHDINLKFTTLDAPIKVQVCFIRTQQCNDWKIYDTLNVWYTPATDVRDYTNYRFGFQVTHDTNVAMQVAD